MTIGEEYIELIGVTTNNLKSLNVKFALGQVTVVTGVSGSGKSSLVFDTLYGESYRRYVESLSSFARQYLKRLPKPGLEQVRGLPPAVAVKQTRSGANSRSTVGTLTELIDLIRIIFIHLSRLVCTECAVVVERDNGESIAEKVSNAFAGHKILILAPLSHLKKMKAADLKNQLEVMGFSRAFIQGELKRVEDCNATALKDGDIVVDRLEVKPENRARLVESVSLALKAGAGQVGIYITNNSQRLGFSSQLKCEECQKEFYDLTDAALNFNHPAGACADCQGFGRIAVLDSDKIITDQDQSLKTKGVVPWNFGKHVAFYSWADRSAQKIGLDTKKSFRDYSPKECDWLYNGSGRSGEGFPGIAGYFNWLDRKKYKPHYRIHAARFKKYVRCPVCQGERLNSNSLSYQINGENIAFVCRKKITELANWISVLADSCGSENTLKHNPGSDSPLPSMGVSEALEEAGVRLAYLNKVGVGYLSLDRTARTLSGGELQRINMARGLGSAFTGTLFCLDEPSAGLHPRDSHNLMEIMYQLKEQGNTVVVVEHEQGIIERADRLLEIGPKAGHLGGYVVYDGNPDERPDQEHLVWPRGSSPSRAKAFIELSGARTHNLKGIDIRIPLRHFTAVCGVSGSGKTSLVQHTLYPMLARALRQKTDDLESECVADKIGPVALLAEIGEVILVSQRSIGRSSRSNIATYLGVFDEIRKLLASTQAAKARRLKAGDFSFNVAGGRCETCKGLGYLEEDLSFLGEITVTCSACEGKRFSEKVLEVEYKGQTLINILNLTVDEARVLFFDRPMLVKIFDTIIDIGLGYITLGQSTSSFSGGEAQRLKLLNILKDSHIKPSALLIFDEPTTGLSDRDVIVLLRQFRNLVEKGHTIIVVEHHLGVLKAADWLIEIGPLAADEGGDLVFAGEPSQLKMVLESQTAAYF